MRNSTRSLDEIARRASDSCSRELARADAPPREQARGDAARGIRCWLAWVGVLVSFAIAFFATFVRADSPTSRPASTDWPAFHNGGALTGEASAAPAPPLRVRWTYRTDDVDRAGVLGSAAIVGDTVYVADERGTLHAVHLASGARRWAYKSAEGFETSPLMRDGRIFIGDLGGTLHAVNAGDGAKLWTVDTGSSVHASANATPAGGILVANDAGDVLCYNAADGALLWKQQATDRINAAPAVSADAAFVAGCDGELRCFALADGKPLASVKLPSLSAGSPALVGDAVVVGTDLGNVLRLEAATLKTIWTFAEVTNRAMVYSSPAVSNGVVVFGARDRRVWAIDLATGAQKWSVRTRGEVDSSPAIGDGRVYIGSGDKKFYVLDLQSGQELWTFNAGRAISASPAIGRGVVVVGDEAGSVYCFEAQP